MEDKNVETLPIGTRFTVKDLAIYRVTGTSIQGVKAVRYLPTARKYSKVPKLFPVGTKVHVLAS